MVTVAVTTFSPWASPSRISVVTPSVAPVRTMRGASLRLSGCSTYASCWPRLQLLGRGGGEYRVIRWRVAQSRVGHLQHLVAFQHQDGDIRGHARKQLLLRILDIDDGLIGDDVLRRRGRLAHLRNLAVEHLGGKRIDANSTFCPTCTCPMSASEMSAVMFILVMSCATVNSTGVLMAAMTVWPSSTLREITMPSTGEVILQYPRFASELCMAAS